MTSDVDADDRASVFELGVLSLTATYFMSQFFRSFLAVLYPDLSRDLGVDQGDLSFSNSVWFWSFALAQFPIGWALDRYGPRASAPALFAAGTGGGAAWLALAEAPGDVALAMALIGLGCAPVLMASFWIFARRFDPSRFALLSATLIAVGSLGNIFASDPLLRLSAALGWRGAAWVLVAVSLFVAVAAALTIRTGELPARPRRDEGRRSGLWRTLAIRELWFIFPLMLTSYAVAAGIRGAWIGPYLVDMHGFQKSDVGDAALLMASAMALGALMMGPLDRWFGTRKGVVLAGNGVVLAAVVTLALAPDLASTAAVALLIVVGAFGVAYPVMMAHGRAFVPLELTGRGVTLLNFFSIVGVALTLSVTGAVFEAVDGAGAAAYRAVFAVYAGALPLGLLIYLAAPDRPPERAR